MAQDGSEFQGIYDLNPKQQALLIALLESPSITEAARVAGVSRRTATRMLADANFQDALRRAQDQALLFAMTSYQDAFSSVRRVLQDLAENTKTPPTVRARAAASLGALTLRAAEHRRRVHDSDVLEAELAELRRLVESTQSYDSGGGYGI